ncbi:MAG: amino acid adenylation domain-containing protein [Actinomycetota bacterium]
MTDQPHLLSSLVPRAALARPDDVAATCDQASMTWAELDGATGRLAAVLVDLGVGPGDRVGILVHKSLESLIAVHGILRAGAAYVPIDPMAPVDTVAMIVDDCGIEVLVSHEPRRPGLERLVAGGARLRAIIGLDGPLGAGSAATIPFASLTGEDTGVEPIPPVPVLGDDLAYVMYTSGSTGRPKGIMHTNRSGLAYATMSARFFALGPHDRMANFSPLHFDMSTFEVLAGVAAGARVVLIPEPHLRLPASLTQLVADQGCTTLYTVPSLFQQMLTRGALGERDLSSVRLVLPAGEVFPPEPLRELVALLPHARFANVYGPAEVNHITTHVFDADDVETALDPEPGATGASATLPIGIACPDVELRVVDDDDRPVTDGERGYLQARAATMMAGYWNRPDLDAAGFVDETGAGGLRRRWYRTGDLVHVDERGWLRYHGRGDNQVKIRGNRVELEQVEAAVGSLAGVENAVVGIRRRSGGDDELVAAYVAAGPTEPDSWRRELAALLPAYAVPAAFEACDRFPLTPSGKIDRRSVRDDIAASDPTSA